MLFAAYFPFAAMRTESIMCAKATYVHGHRHRPRYAKILECALNRGVFQSVPGRSAMRTHEIDRRAFVKRVGIAALGASALHAPESYVRVQVPNSVGTESPKLKAPAGACDCHHHIYDAARFPPKDPGPQSQPATDRFVQRIVENGRVEEYKLLQRRIGTTRNIIVTPAAYVDQNNITLDGIARLAPNARGVALLTTTVSDPELKRLTD